MGSRLKHAVAVGRLGSFSRAAEAVGVTQSAVTKSVADLERQLGYALFHRTSRGAVTTEAGREFIDRATRLLADAAELMGEGDRKADPYHGVIRIGVFPGSLEWMLTEPLTALLQRHPGVRFSMVSGGSERGVQLLTRGDIDIAFGMMAAFSVWSQFKCELVGGLEATPFVRRDHPVLGMGPTRAETLVRFDFIVPSSSEPYTSVIEQMYAEAGEGEGLADRLHVIDFFPLVRRIVAASDAIGVIAKSATNNRAFHNRFVALTDFNLLDAPPLACATRARWPAKPAVRALIAQCRRVYGAESARAFG